MREEIEGRDKDGSSPTQKGAKANEKQELTPNEAPPSEYQCEPEQNGLAVGESRTQEASPHRSVDNAKDGDAYCHHGQDPQVL
jgi:hypothetical protein